MPMPTAKDVHQDAALSQFSTMHRNQMFVADRVFPHVRVNKQSDYYYKFLKGAWFRTMAGRKGHGSKTQRSGYKVTTGTYACEKFAQAHPIPIGVINNADIAIRPWQNGVRFATNSVLLRKEYEVSSIVTTAGNWTSSEDVEGAWANTDSTNTVIGDVNGAKETVRKLIGAYPNVLLVNAATMVKLKEANPILERIKYMGFEGNPADVTPNVLAQLFELDEVIVGGASYSDAEEVVAGTDFNAVDLWETNANHGGAFLFYREPAPALESPNTGYIVTWPGDEGGEHNVIDVQSEANGPVRTVDYWWEEDEEQYIVRAAEWFDVIAAGADGGYLFYDTIQD